MTNRTTAQIITSQSVPKLEQLFLNCVSAPETADVFGVFNFPHYTVFPGFCDVHVHFREPGFSYKETMATGSSAAARGGYTVVCTMPNLKPVPDTKEHLSEQLDIIKKDACIASDTGVNL